MPIKRKSIKRSKRSSKPWYDKTSVGDVARQAWSGVKWLKEIVNAEKKYFDTTTGSATYVDYNGVLLKLSEMATGTTNITRTGNSIKANSLYIRTSNFMHASATATYLRMIIFIDKSNTGTDPTISDILTDTGSVSVVNSPLKLDRGTRYDILKDKTVSLDIGGNRAGIWNTFLRLKHHIKYAGSNATDFYTGQVYMLLVSNEQTFTPNCNVHARLAFYDN